MKAALLCAALVCGFIGCASVPVTVAQAEISGILDSGVFDDAHVVTPEDKAKLRLAMTHARDNIGAAEERRADAEEKAASSATWATRGKWLFGGILAAAFLFFLGAGGYVARKFI